MLTAFNTGDFVIYTSVPFEEDQVGVVQDLPEIVMDLVNTGYWSESFWVWVYWPWSKSTKREFPDRLRKLSLLEVLAVCAVAREIGGPECP